MEIVSVKELFDMFKSKIITIIMIIFLTVSIGCIVSFFIIPHQFESYTSIILGKIENENTEVITQEELNLNQNLISTYIEIIKSYNVISKVQDNLKLNDRDILKNLTVGTEKNSQIIIIKYRDSDPEVAKKVTQEITNVCISKIKEIYNINNIHIIDEARKQDRPVNINHTRDLLVAGFVGCLISVAYVFVDFAVRKSVLKEEWNIM